MLSVTTITGRLTQAPQLRQTPGGKDVATLRVAVSDHRLDGETRFVDIDQWEQAARNACEHLTVGQEIAAEGLLDVRPYVTDAGELRAGWSLQRARVEWGPKPLRDVPTERPRVRGRGHRAGRHSVHIERCTEASAHGRTQVVANATASHRRTGDFST